MGKQEDFEFDEHHLDLKKDESGPMIIMTSVFMLWGFLTVMNESLSSKIKAVLDLSDRQENLLSFVFFASYFVVGLIFYLVSRYLIDPFERFGFKKIIIAGLILTAMGCFLFYPAATMADSGSISQVDKFIFFLSTMLVLASGIAVLQIAANPYVILMGNEKNAAARINLSQAFNSLGTYLAPLIATLLFVESDLKIEASSIKMPYLILGLAVLLLAFFFNLSRLPDINRAKPNPQENQEKRTRTEPQLILGAIAIFLYVGGEVAIGSHLADFLKLDYIAGLTDSAAQNYTALYWGGAMAGRFAGAVYLSKIERRAKTRVVFFLIILSYLLAISITGDAVLSLTFASLFTLNLFAFKIGNGRSTSTLTVFGMTIMLCLILGMTNQGSIAMWSIIMIGMFNSIMFPNIFRIALKNLQHKTSTGSALLVMSIVGGAIIPGIQNYLIRVYALAIQYSFVIPLLCYAYIAYYGYTTNKRNG